jgi:hypothetical protein
MEWTWTTGIAVCAAVLGISIPETAIASDPANLDGESPPVPIAQAAALSNASAATFVTIDFETFPDTSPVPGGAVITNQYAPLGVTFDSTNCAPGATQITNVINFVPTTSPPNSLAPCGPAPFNGATLLLWFDPPVSEISAFFVDDQFPVVVTAFDADGNQVDQAQSDGSRRPFDQVVLAFGGGIADVEMVGGFWSFPNAPDGWSIDNLEFIQLLTLVVEIDIKPGSDPNSINPFSRGVIPVAILTTEDFDAVTVDADSVRFGPDEAEKRHKKAHVEDVDGDGDLDLLLHFRTQDTGIALGDTEACLIGQTYDGVPIEGCDSLRTVPRK